jgi:hypothetical protein
MRVKWTVPCGCIINQDDDTFIVRCSLHQNATIEDIVQWCKDNQPTEDV